jgi:polar amino acid transport system substrate-binding protein
MKKKLLATVLALTLGAVALTGCASSSKDAASAASSESAKTETATTESTTKAAGDTAKAGASTSTARTLSEIKDSGKIVIGVFSDKKPFGYVDENGKYQGYDVYLGDRIAKDLGVEVEYVPVEAASRVEYLVTAKVDIILANFTVTEERAQQVDFALPYMKVALGVVSPDSAPIIDASQLNGKTLIVSKGTTAETYFTENYPDVKLLKFDQYSEAYNALLDGRGDALSTDNTEVLAWAIENKGYSVGVESLGSLDTIAPAVQKGNKELLDWINNEIVSLADEKFFHADYDATLAPVYGDAADPENLVVEGGVVEK